MAPPPSPPPSPHRLPCVHLQRRLPLDLSPVRLPSRHRGEDAPSHGRPRPAPILASSPVPCPPWYEAKRLVEIGAELLQVDASLSMVAVVPRGASQNPEGHEVVQLPRKVVPCVYCRENSEAYARGERGGGDPPKVVRWATWVLMRRTRSAAV